MKEFLEEARDAIESAVFGAGLVNIVIGAAVALGVGFLLSVLVICLKNASILSLSARTDKFLRTERYIGAHNVKKYSKVISSKLDRKGKRAWNQYVAERTRFRKENFLATVLYPKEPKRYGTFAYNLIAVGVAVFLAAVSGAYGLSFVDFLMIFAVGVLIFLFFEAVLLMSALIHRKRVMTASGNLRFIFENRVNASDKEGLDGLTFSDKTKAEKKQGKKEKKAYKKMLKNNGYLGKNRSIIGPVGTMAKITDTEYAECVEEPFVTKEEVRDETKSCLQKIDDNIEELIENRASEGVFSEILKNLEDVYSTNYLSDDNQRTLRDIIDKVRMNVFKYE